MARPVDITQGAAPLARAALAAIAGLSVYGRKAQRKMQVPCVTVRKVGEDTIDYVDQRGVPSASILRLELRANSEAECDRLYDEIDAAMQATGRLLDRSLYYEGVETDSGSDASASALYRLTLQYRIAEI